MADGMASEGLAVTVKLGDAGSFAFTSDDPHRLLSVLSGGGGTIKFRGRDRDSEITGDALILEKPKAARVEFGAATQTAVPQEVSFFFFSNVGASGWWRSSRSSPDCKPRYTHSFPSPPYIARPVRSPQPPC